MNHELKEVDVFIEYIRIKPSAPLQGSYAGSMTVERIGDGDIWIPLMALSRKLKA